MAIAKIPQVEAFVKNISEDTNFVVTCYIGILILGLLLILYIIRRNEVKKQYNKLFRDIIAFIGDRDPKTALKYEPRMLISEEAIKRMGLFNFDVLKIAGNDYTYVQYDNKELCFSDLRLFYQSEEKSSYTRNGIRYTKTTKRNNYVFDGLYVGFPLQQKNTSHIYLIPNNIKYTLFQSKVNDFINYEGENVRLDNLDFAKRYKVYSYNEEQTRNILNESLMKKINILDKFFTYKKYIIFKTGTRFALCIQDLRLSEIKENIKFPSFNNKKRELKALTRTFERLNDIFNIYHILSSDD